MRVGYSLSPKQMRTLACRPARAGVPSLGSWRGAARVLDGMGGKPRLAEAMLCIKECCLWLDES